MFTGYEPLFAPTSPASAAALYGMAPATPTPAPAYGMAPTAPIFVIHTAAPIAAPTYE